jgi:hypothetical protein
MCATVRLLLLIVAFFSFSIVPAYAKSGNADKTNQLNNQLEDLRKLANNAIAKEYWTERKAIVEQIKKAWAEGDFTTLDSLATQYRTSRELLSDGSWKLKVFYDALNEVFNTDGFSDQSFKDVSTKIGDWIKRNPKSPSAIITMAHEIVNKGWAIRGGEFADQVSDQNLKSFMQYMAMAYQLLQTNHDLASVDPEWYSLIFDIIKTQNFKKSVTYELLKEAMKKAMKRY